MKRKNNVCFCILALLIAIFLVACVSLKTRHYNFTLKNTLSVFMLNNEKDHYFCIPVQYMDDYQLGSFDFVRGNIVIGSYEIPLKREEITISIFLNETPDEYGSVNQGAFNLIYSEENGDISDSKMSEPLKAKNETETRMNHYYIFIEKYLKDDEMKKIIKEYEKGNVYSWFEIWYDLIIDNEPQFGNGMLDDFELYDGLAIDPAFFPPNLDFFKVKYLQN